MVVSKKSKRQTKAGNQEFQSLNVIENCEKLGKTQKLLSLTFSFYHSLAILLSHSLTLDMLNNFCFHGYALRSLSHSFSLSLSY